MIFEKEIDLLSYLAAVRRDTDVLAAAEADLARVVLFFTVGAAGAGISFTPNSSTDAPPFKAAIYLSMAIVSEGYFGVGAIISTGIPAAKASRAVAFPRVATIIPSGSDAKCSCSALISAEL